MKRILSAGLGLFLVALAARGQTPDLQKNLEAYLQRIRLEQKAAVAYLQKLQQKDGGFAPDASATKSSVSATNAAVRALKYMGAEIPHQSECADFVKSCFDKDSGGFADEPGGKITVNSTAVGVLAATQLEEPRDVIEGGAVVKYLGDNVKTFEDIRIAAAAFEAMGKPSAQADAWLQQIAKLRNDDGSYGKGDGAARDTGSAVAAVLRLGGKVEHPEGAIKAMREGQRADGGFGPADSPSSDLPTSYRIMRSLHMLKAAPADAGRLLAFIDSCRNDDGGYGVAKGKPSSAAGTYYAAVITHWLEEK
jgi:prenyltransferase beta subunit